MESNNYKKYAAYILLILIVISLDIYAWFFASKVTFVILFIAGVILPFIGHDRMGVSASDVLVYIALPFVLVSLLGVYALVNYSYRASVKRQVAEERKAQEEEADIEAAIEKNVFQIIQETDLSQKYVDNYRSGKVFFVWAQEGKPDIVDLKYSFTELDEEIKASHLDDASAIGWIEEENKDVGNYRNNYLGFVPSPFKSGDALVITWRVWLVDVKSRAVTAYQEFTGPDPPPSRVVYAGGAGDYGISPIDDTIEWLETLPTR